MIKEEQFQKNIQLKLIRSAAFLRREFLSRDEYSNSDRTIYIFDTDIIKAYCSPWTTGPHRNAFDRENHKLTGNGYGEPITFPYNSDMSKFEEQKRNIRAELVTKILARYAFQLCNRLPVYQFEPQYEETHRIYTYVRNDASEEMGSNKTYDDRQKERLTRAAAVISSRHNIIESNDRINDIVEHMIRLINQTGLAAGIPRRENLKEWDNFVELNIRSGGIYSVSESYEHFLSMGDEFTDVARALRGFNKCKFEASELNNYEKLIHFWKQKAETKYPLAQDKKKIGDDMKSLALLVLLNERLRKIDWRAVLVTGSQNLVETSFAVTISDAKNLDLESLKNFSPKFVRHLWAYTSVALIEPKAQSKFTNWLDGLLAKWAGHIEYNANELTNLINKPLVKGIGINFAESNNALQNWFKLTGRLVTQEQFNFLGGDSTNFLKLKEKFMYRISNAKSLKMDWDAIIAYLHEDNDQIKDETFLTFSNIGVEAVIFANKANRHPPDLDFESLKNTKKIFKKLASRNGYVAITAGSKVTSADRRKAVEDFEKDYNSIKEECYPPDKDNRQFSHLRYLALGAAFASAGKWSVALSQAQRAIQIIERRKKPYIPVIPTKEGCNLNISGREAYFLAAVALRNIATKSTDFKKSGGQKPDDIENLPENWYLQETRGYLEKAWCALKNDQDKATAKNFDERRLINEELAQSLALYYLIRSSSDDADPQNRLYETINAKVIPVLVSTNSLKQNQSLRGMNAATLANICVNFIQVRVIYEFRKLSGWELPEIIPISNNVLKNSIATIEEIANDNEIREQNSKLIRSKVMEIYLEVAKLILADDPSKQFSSVENAFQNWQQSVVTFYDRWRFLKLEIFSRIYSEKMTK